MKYFSYYALALILCCGSMYAQHNIESNSSSDKNFSNNQLTDQQLVEIISSIYANAQKSNTTESLPAILLSTAQRINSGETIDRALCVDALHCYIDGLSQSLINHSRAVRQDAPMGTNPAVPVVPQFCDLTQVLALLGAIRASIGSISDSACDQTIFGILGDACTILSGQNICEALLQIEHCCASISATVQGVNTFTVLADLKATMSTDFLQTWTILADLKATMSTDFLQTWTILSAIQSEISAGQCNATFIHNSDVGTTGYVITTSGTYKLAENINFAPVGSGVAITIETSNVILDLQCFIIAQTNSAVGTDAIDLSDGTQNVTVQNGQIHNFTEYGIVSLGTSGFVIQDITIQNCKVGAMFISQSLGGASASGIIDGCTISGCCSDNSASAAITLNATIDTRISNCSMINTGLNNPSSGNILSGISGTSCSDIVFDNIVSTTGQAVNFSAFKLNTSSNCQFNNCSSIGDQMFGSTGINNTCAGFNMLSCNGIFFNNCTVQGFISSSGTFLGTGNIIGFLIANSTSMLLNNCQVLNCSNTVPSIPEFFGIEFNSTTLSMCNNCNVVGNSSTDPCTGIFLNASSSNTIRNCVATLNSSSNSSSTGLSISTSNNNIFDGCQFSRSVGNSDANSFGISLTSGSNNIFTQCRGLFNGSTAANQLSGIAAGSAVNVNSTNMTSAIGPWTNIGVIP